METMGKRLKQMREARGLRVYEVAGKLGMDDTYYSGIENDRRPNLTAETLTKLADFYDCSIDYILSGKTVEQPLVDFVAVLPPDEAEFVRQHSDDAWIELVKKMTADELSPADVKAMIEAIQVIRGQLKL